MSPKEPLPIFRPMRYLFPTRRSCCLVSTLCPATSRYRVVVFSRGMGVSGVWRWSRRTMVVILAAWPQRREGAERVCVFAWWCVPIPSICTEPSKMS